MILTDEDAHAPLNLSGNCNQKGGEVIKQSNFSWIHSLSSVNFVISLTQACHFAKMNVEKWKVSCTFHSTWITEDGWVFARRIRTRGWYNIEHRIQAAPTKTTRRAQLRRNTFELYLQLVGLYIGPEISPQLMECIPSNSLRGMFALRNSLYSRLSFVVCLRRPV